jgi:predicted secreted protein
VKFSIWASLSAEQETLLSDCCVSGHRHFLRAICEPKSSNSWKDLVNCPRLDLETMGHGFMARIGGSMLDLSEGCF